MIMLMAIVPAAASAALIASTRLAAYVMTGERRQTLEEAMAWQSSHYDTSFYQWLEKTDYVVTGCKGYALHVQELRNPNPTDRYVILSHGYTDNRYGSLKYVPMYLELGYHCVIYDLRGHGENEPTFTTYGLRESEDLAAVIEEVRARHPEMSRLGLHGESLGAATSVAVLKRRPNVDFVVADCGFATLENVIRDGYRNMKAPSFLFSMADVGARTRYGCSLKDMRPVDALDENQIPVLFIHGENDTFVSPRNSQEMYDRTKGPRAIRYIPGADHAASIFKDPDAYKRYVAEFLRDIGL